jgi:negative elongation factor C/D
MPFASDRGDHVNTAVPSTDEAYFLRSLVYEHFDPGRFAGVFESARHPAIGMINALITDADGRDLLYRLTLRHPDSLLLSFALAKILKEPGNDEEMAAALSAFIGPLEVFHKLLGARLRQAAEASDEATMQRLVKEMVESARCGQHGYVYAQLLLHALASEREGDGSGAGRFQRMAQELEAAAPLPSRWKMQRWFVPGQAGEDAVAAAAAVGDVLSRASASSHVPISEVLKLQKLYYCCGKTNGDDDASTVPRGGEDGTAKHQRVGDGDGPRASSGTQTQTLPTTPHHSPPPLTIIRHPELLKALLAALFAPGKQLKPEVLSAHVDVIAAAVAGTTPEGQDPPTPAAGSLALQPAVGAVREALATAAELAHKVAGERVLSRDEVVRLEGAVSERIAAAGVLSMLRSMLTSQEYWTTTYHIHKEPPFLPLLTAIVERQPSMQDDVLSLIVDALGAMGSSAGGPDTARALLGVAAKLAHVGHVEPVLSWIERWARTADTGLVRHFAFKLLEGAAPPYSPWFAATVLRLAAAGGVKRQRIGAKEWTARSPLLAEFAEGCASVEFDPPLGWEEAACLRDLRTSLSV